MKKTITKIRGLTVNVEVVEVCQMDREGGILCYVAAIYVQVHGNAEKTLVRKSRLPGAAAALKAEIQRDGIRTFAAFHRARMQRHQASQNLKRKKLVAECAIETDAG